ncbi:MAG: DUF5131 family protein [Rhodospirillaceae bacterium]|nr:DUF5131 family protein [Rhodospirillaceae bacterium]
MTVLNTRISCADHTWNPVFGCTHVSPGCDHCYAEAIAKRFHGGFQVRLMPHRLADVRRFKPVVELGRRRAPLVFVNSMSDLYHREVPDAYLDRVFQHIATRPDAVFQILTKRPRRLLEDGRRRWGDGGVPQNLWLGVTVEDRRLARRVDMLRSLKQAAGPFTAFICAEPLLSAFHGISLDGIDWLILGGETGPGARRLDPAWADQAVAAAEAAGVPVWFRQWGRWQHHPYWPDARGRTVADRKADLIARGLELSPADQGGATLQGRLWRERPLVPAA